MRGRVFRNRRFVEKRAKACLAAALVLLLLVGALAKCRPSLTAFAESEAVWIATRIANETVASVLLQDSDLCNQMVHVSYTESGQLSSVIPDSAAVNEIRTDITDTVMARIEQLDSLSVSIPTGTLIGPGWLSGWGPMVTFPISFTATVLSDASSTLEAAGINQSTYRVMIHLDISLYVVTPGGRSSVGTQLSYPMAEAVLLGEVPDNLTEVYGDDQSLLGKIFDYGTAD